jgi:hypothetical protein
MRPTRLLLPGQIEPQDPLQIRMVRLARLGQTAARRAIAGGGTSASERASDAWPALAFDFICGDFRGALRQLDALELSTQDSDARLRLLGLRAQILAELGQGDAALAVLDYLHESDRARGDGRPRAAARWVSPLASAIAARLARAREPDAVGD